MGAFRVPQELVRLGARLTSRRALDPGLPWEVQRRRLDRLVGTWPPLRRTPVARISLNGVPAEVVTPVGPVGGMGDDTVGSPAGGTAGDTVGGLVGSTVDDRAGGPSDGPVGSTVTVVHFHGGGYCVGSPAESRDWAAQVSARAGCRMILPDYRLAPEHPYPAGLRDARAALRAVLDGTVPGGAATGPVIVSGDSAGGGLALILAQDEVRSPRLAGCMLMSPWLDLTADWSADPGLARRDVVLTPAWLRACADAYAPRGEDRTRREISPLLGDLAGLPPLLIQCGTDDLVAPDSVRLEARARAAGVDVTSGRWPRLWHNFPLQPGLIAAADAAVAQTAGFIARASATRR